MILNLDWKVRVLRRRVGCILRVPTCRKWGGGCVLARGAAVGAEVPSMHSSSNGVAIRGFWHYGT